MNRSLLGLIALGLLLGGVWVQFSSGESGVKSAASAGVRIGLVLGALWLALPQITEMFAKTPRWLLLAGVIVVAVVAINPMLLWFAAPVLIAVWLLNSRFGGLSNLFQPRSPTRRTRRQRDDPDQPPPVG